MNRREILKGSTALAAVAAAGIRPASAQAPIVIKFSHVVATDAPKGKACEKFKELAEKYTGGKAKVEVYANSSLYKDKEELEALQLGAVQLLAPSTAKFGPLGFTEFEALDLPFIFHDEANFRKFAEQRPRQADVRQARDQGCQGPRLLGQRLLRDGRQQADPQRQGLPGPQAAHPGLQGARCHHQGLGRHSAGDGILRGLSRAADGRRRRRSKTCPRISGHRSSTRSSSTSPSRYHGHLSYAVVANNKFWDGLPADVRPGLDKAIAEASTYFDSIAKKENDDALEEIKKLGKVQRLLP